MSEQMKLGDLSTTESFSIRSPRVLAKTNFIPDDWKLKSASTIADINTGHTPSRENPEYWDGDIPWIAIHDLTETNTIEIEETSESITQEGLENSGAKLLRKGSFVLCRTGSIGASAILEKEMATDQSTVSFECIKNQSNPYYLNYVFSNCQSELDRLGIGSTHPSIQLDFFPDLELPTPPIVEQRKIATVLYTVDRAIEHTEKIIEQTEKIGRGLRQSLFTDGYDVHETESYGTLGEVPKEWEKTRLHKIAKVERGKFTHRPRNDPEFYNGEYPFIQTAEVVNSIGQLTDFNQSLNEKGREVSREFDAGTIIITIAGNIGDTAIATFPVYFPDSLVGITPDEKIDERFLEQFLRYRQDFLNRLSTKTTQKNLNLTLLRPIEVVKPPLDEQEKIGDVLSTIDNKIRKEKEYKIHLCRIKNGLMQDLLSGKTRTTDTNIQVPDKIAQYG